MDDITITECTDYTEGRPRRGRAVEHGLWPGEAAAGGGRGGGRGGHRLLRLQVRGAAVDTRYLAQVAIVNLSKLNPPTIVLFTPSTLACSYLLVPN